MNIIKNNLSLYPQTRKIFFNDDTFTLDKKWLSDFCSLYKKEIGLPFLCNARVDTIDEEVVKWLRDAGCSSINFGVESGNEWLRVNIMNRRHSNKRIKEAFSITRKYGLKTFSYNMVGLPFETKERAIDTLKLNLEIKPDFGKCFYFYPYPGSKIHQMCLEHNLLTEDVESVSGYLQAPSIKERFMSHREMKKYFELMQVFFYSRLLFSKIRLPSLPERLFLNISLLLRKPILLFLDPMAKNNIIVKLRKTMRKFAMRYLR